MLKALSVSLLLGLALPGAAATALPSLDSTRAAPTLQELEPRARYTFSGLRYVVLKPGQGALPKAGDVMKVKYLGWTTDGMEFDGSYKRGEPFRFNLGRGEVIKGWDEGLADMRPGERRYLIIPPELGYGAQPAGSIPANSTLIFDVERADF